MGTLPFKFSREQIWDCFIKGAMDAFIVSNASHVIIEWSPYAETLFGWNAAEAIGRKLTDLIIPPKHREAHERGIKEYLAIGHHRALNKRLEVTALHKNGHEVPIELSVVPIHIGNQVFFGASIRDNLERKRTLEGLRQKAALLNLSSDAIVVTDLEYRILFWNRGAEKMLGFSEEEALGQYCHELLKVEFSIPEQEILDTLTATGHWKGERTYTRKDGIALTVLSRLALERDDEGNPARILISSTDMTFQKQAIQTASLLQESEQRFRSIFEHHPDGVFAFDSELQIVAANPALTSLTGFSTEELLALSATRPHLVAMEDLNDVLWHAVDALRGTPQTCEAVLVRKGGRRFDARITMIPIIINSEIIGVHGIIKDISQHKHIERRVQHLANHDPLTDLPNRTLLEDRMQHALEQARRASSEVGVLFMDLNRFKIINDSLGHDVGDELLCTIARRLKSGVREVDTVARLGGDEFVVILESINNSQAIHAIAENLLKLVSQPVDLRSNVLTVTTSIGISVYPHDGQDAASLLKHADLAMYEAKASGAGTAMRYNAAMSAKVLERLNQERSLRQAFEKNEFVLHYQPRVDINENRVVGVEALLRWNHPQDGLIFPASFIELAEDIGLIDELGEWVLNSACHQNKMWQDRGLPPLTVSVNLSALQLRSSHICESIVDALSQNNLDPRYLDLEITECSLMQNIETSFARLNDIRKLGVTLSINDFGTGYSSLSYLRKLPIDALKIDRTFIDDISQGEEEAIVVTATIAMAHSMHLKVIAEGVTSDAQMRFLKLCQCDEAQGYLLCHPLPASEVEKYLRAASSQKTASMTAH
jgi:diguanylate cyclase (GGDEF)-like protein/PAS domain S-box-containing protein